jgi:hypothetical protein
VKKSSSSVKKSTFFHAKITFFHAAPSGVKKSNSSVKKSNFSVKKILFFTLASMKKSRFGKVRLFLRQKKSTPFFTLEFHAAVRGE